MAETVTGVRPFARAWMHVGTVRIGGARMAKSTGNLVLVADVVAKYPPAALRLVLLDRRWADDWDYDPAALDVATARLERLYAAASRGVGEADSVAAASVTSALLDDLDVPGALAVAEESGGEAARLALALLALT